MHCGCFLRKGVVYVPTYGMIEKGFYRAIEPVAVVAVEETKALRLALLQTIDRGNPPVPSLPRGEWPKPVVLKYAGVRTWLAFARETSNWSIQERDGIYKIQGYQTTERGSWKEDPAQTISFPPGTEVDTIIDRLIAILQAATQI